MRRLSHTVIKNILANGSRLGVGALVALVLPPFLVRSLDRDHFAAWSLLLQISAFANFVDFGIQTAIAKFVAEAMARHDDKARDAYISTACFMLSCAGLIAFVGISGVAVLIPHIYRNAPMNILPELRAGLILMAALAALTLPTSAFTGAFVGLHKNEYPAFISGVGRVVGAALVMVMVRKTHSLVAMAAIIGGMNLLSGLAQYWFARRVLPTMTVSVSAITKVYLRSLIRFCASLAIMSFSMFLVNGIDLTLLGYLRFSEVAYYSVASTLALLVSGVASAAVSALVAPIASVYALGEQERVGKIILKSTRHLTLILGAITFVLLVGGKYFMTLWVGTTYANASINILYVLAFASAIRVIVAPYYTALVAADHHGRVALAPLFEGVVNLVVSVIAGYYLGAIGIAIGTLIGAIAGVSLILLYVMPKIPEIGILPSTFTRGVIEPILLLAPAVTLLYLGLLRTTWSGSLRLAMTIVATALVALWYKRNKGTAVEGVA